MRRPIRNGLTGLSLAVAAFAAVGWVTAAVVATRFEYAAVDRSADPVEWATIATLTTAPNQLQLGMTRIRLDRGRSLVTLDAYIPVGFSWQTSPPPAGRGRMLPAVVRGPPVDTGFGTRSAVTVSVPFWAILAAGSALPAWRLRRWRAKRRRPTTACPRCGYDLRASAGRCPECGRDGRAGVTSV